jgi:hypothetical protein
MLKKNQWHWAVGQRVTGEQRVVRGEQLLDHAIFWPCRPDTPVSGYEGADFGKPRSPTLAIGRLVDLPMIGYKQPAIRLQDALPPLVG